MPKVQSNELDEHTTTQDETEITEEEEVENVEAQLEAMRQRVKEMEEEQTRIQSMQNQLEKDLTGTLDDAKEEVDARSVYVGNVDYEATPEELQNHFNDCGAVNRVTILTDKFGNPKGFAYIEFCDKDSVEQACLLDGSEFRSRQLKVNPKRTNVPGMTLPRGRGRGRGAPRGRGRGRGAPRGRGRGRGGYHPYS